MKLVAPFVLLAAAVGLAEASQGHHAGLSRISTHHQAIHQRNEARAVENATNLNKKRGTRCKPRASAAPPAQNNAVKTEPSKAPEPPKAEPAKPAPPPPAPPAKNDDKKNDDNKNDSKPAPPPPAAPSVGGLIKVTSDQCGAAGAESKSSAQNGPNGRLDWLNCGIDGSGWNPPHVTPQDLITKSLGDAVNQPNSPFSNCKPFLSTFENYANQHGIPPILIASIAMQESGCNPGAVGGGGEQGLMQITKEKCGGAPGGNCRDPDFNIRTGVEFFATTLKNNGNNVVKTLGMYNGWYPGLTVGKATAAAHSSCCRCQNNLDYLQQTFNGWILGIDPISAGFGKFFNLKVCGN